MLRIVPCKVALIRKIVPCTVALIRKIVPCNVALIRKQQLGTCSTVFGSLVCTHCRLTKKIS